KGQQVGRTGPGPAHPPALEPAVHGELDVLLRGPGAVQPPTGTHPGEGVQVGAVAGEVAAKQADLLGVTDHPSGQEVAGQALGATEGPPPEPRPPLQVLPAELPDLGPQVPPVALVAGGRGLDRSVEAG